MPRHDALARKSTPVKPYISATVHAINAGKQHCRLCDCLLNGTAAGDDVAKGVCRECRLRPEARRLGALSNVTSNGKQRQPARDFTPAERALIAKVHGYMSPSQLLAVLNERLACDLGPDAAPYTLEQLHNEVRSSADPTTQANNWASLRKLLAHARRDGVLDAVTTTTIDDFAVVFSLSPSQVVRLKDVILGSATAKGERA